MEYLCKLTHRGWGTLICVSKQAIIGSDDSLLPVRHQAIILTIAGLLLIHPMGAYLNFEWNMNLNITCIEENKFENDVLKLQAISP